EIDRGRGNGPEIQADLVVIEGGLISDHVELEGLMGKSAEGADDHRRTESDVGNKVRGVADANERVCGLGRWIEVDVVQGLRKRWKSGEEEAERGGKGSHNFCVAGICRNGRMFNII